MSLRDFRQALENDTPSKVGEFLEKFKINNPEDGLGCVIDAHLAHCSGCKRYSFRSCFSM